MQIENYYSENLSIDRFSVQEGEAWCIIGSNTSGISSFIQLFSDKEKGPIFTAPPAIISFSKQQEIFEEELRNDDSNFLDRIDPGTPARDFITNIDQYDALIHAFHLEHCMEKGYRQLSTGESRKLLLLSSLSENPGIIVIENPYDGLDNESCTELDKALEILHQHGRSILVTVNNVIDIPKWCSHLAVFSGIHIALQGTLADIYDKAEAIISQNGRAAFTLKTDTTSHNENEELISLVDGSARYGERCIFSGLDLLVQSGQHTLITGPNGSGKSTLLQIICGDNQNCYANELYLFGNKRGSGESIWEIKKQMGIVSPDLHRNHYIPGSALQVVLSGFFDSIGIYNKFTPSQKSDALEWLTMIGLEHKAKHSFRNLSFSEQRLCLIARALIKLPKLLILDEPTQGLDQLNRESLLNFLELVCEKKISTILYASHRSDEFRSFFMQHIRMAGEI